MNDINRKTIAFYLRHFEKDENILHSLLTLKTHYIGCLWKGFGSRH